MILTTEESATFRCAHHGNKPANCSARCLMACSESLPAGRIRHRGLSINHSNRHCYDASLSRLGWNGFTRSGEITNALQYNEPSRHLESDNRFAFAAALNILSPKAGIVTSILTSITDIGPPARSESGTERTERCKSYDFDIEPTSVALVGTFRTERTQTWP